MKDDQLYLAHIKDAINCVEEFTKEGKDHFVEDRKTRDAVLRNLQTLSESLSKLSQPFKDQLPQVPWNDINGFRNVIVHDYLGLDVDETWEIIEQDLPRLKGWLTPYL